MNAKLAIAEVSPGPVDIFDALPVPALIFDTARTCMAANAAARSLFEPGEPVGLGSTALFAEWRSAPDLWQAHATEAAQTATVVHADGRCFRPQQHFTEGLGLCVTLTDVSLLVNQAQATSRDSLTGLLQRAALKQALVGMVAQAAPDSGVAVHYVDLDRFKGVNDSLGHAIGDVLLAKVADRLRSVLQPGDFLARLGGDEFVVVQAPAGSREAAATLGARICDLVGRTYAIKGHTINIGASVGIARFPEHASDADTLLSHADLALYRAKADGRGTFRFFEPVMNARMQARRLLELDLRRALAFRQFYMVYQPQIGLASNQVVGFEALIRWQHPERGLVPPADFIPLAEEIGLITPIGEWALRTACREAASWSFPATIAVNISPVQFKGGKLVQTVTSALAQTGLAANRLDLEITEGALLDDTDSVLAALHALKAMGVRVSMDDFGTGYSSLSYLKKFPFDKIKIDQSFVRGMGESTDSDAIVRAVARLGASLGMRTVAEGVETEAQLDLVRQEGCTDVQGYLTGRPVAADQIAQLLQGHTQGETV